MKIIVLITIAIISSTVGNSQTIFCNDALNTLIENQTENAERVDFVDDLTHMYHHKVDLNKLTHETLQQFSFLNSGDVQSILTYKARQKFFINVLELQQCDISLEKAKTLACFTNVTNAQEENTESNVNHSITLTYKRVIDDFTDQSKSFNGNLWGTVFRYRGTYLNNIHLSYTGEKDPGEKMFSKSNKVYDFNSLSLRITKHRYFNELIIGDYALNFGEGLTQGGGLSLGKSSLVMRTLRSGKSVRPYHSVTENNFQRGVCLSKNFRALNATIWYSRNKEDATIDTSTNDDKLKRYSSFQFTGLHRTSKEIQNKNSIPVGQMGVNLTMNSTKFRVGLTGAFTSIKGIRVIEPSEYKPYLFVDSRFMKIGINYKATIKNTLLYGETTIGSNNSAATIMGGLISLNKSVSVAIHHRRLSPQFIPNYTNAFTEYSTGNNEVGTYLGLELSHSRSWTIRTYMDFYRRPEISFNTISPTNGTDYIFEIRHTPSKKLVLYFRLKNEAKDKPIAEQNGQKIWVKDRLLRSRFHFQYEIDRNTSIRTRFEISDYKKGLTQTSGDLLYQDLVYKMKRRNISFKMRLAIANIQDFENRIYTYENDMAFSYSLPFYSENKVRAYGLIHFRTRKHLEYWFRFAIDNKSAPRSFTTEVKSVSSPSRTEVKFQVRYQL